MEKIVKITWNEEEKEVVLKPVNWGMYKKIRRKSIVLKEFEGKPHQFRDMEMYDDFLTLFSIRVAPFDKILENLHKLSMKDGAALQNAAAEVNRFES